MPLGTLRWPLAVSSQMSWQPPSSDHDHLEEEELQVSWPDTSDRRAAALEQRLRGMPLPTRHLEQRQRYA